jgi:hypothetical protein
MLTVSSRAGPEERNRIFEAVSASIENGLGADPKNLWLFQTGRLINPARQEDSEITETLRVHLPSAPDNVSIHLIKALEELVSSAQTDRKRFRESLRDLRERLYGLGN